MLINLSKLLSHKGESEVVEVTIDMNTFQCSLGNYTITEKNPILLTLTNEGSNSIHYSGEVSLTLSIPCDRCLTPVATPINFTLDGMVELGDRYDDDAERVEEKEEQDYIEGYNLDVDKLVFGEVLMNIPAKVLCREDCKGLCPNCGQNLNESECGCDRVSLDPRMSVIQDIFNNFKEV